MKKTIIAAVSAVLVLSLCACGEKTTDKSGILTGMEQFSVTITASDGTVYTYSIDGTTVIDSNAENFGDTVEIISSGKYEAGIHAEEIS